MADWQQYWRWWRHWRRFLATADTTARPMPPARGRLAMLDSGGSDCECQRRSSSAWRRAAVERARGRRPLPRRSLAAAGCTRRPRPPVWRRLVVLESGFSGNGGGWRPPPSLACISSWRRSSHPRRRRASHGHGHGQRSYSRRSLAAAAYTATPRPSARGRLAASEAGCSVFGGGTLSHWRQGDARLLSLRSLIRWAGPMVENSGWQPRSGGLSQRYGQQQAAC
jgi:hypothetical protein